MVVVVAVVAVAVAPVVVVAALVLAVVAPAAVVGARAVVVVAPAVVEVADAAEQLSQHGRTSGSPEGRDCEPKVLELQ